MTDKKVTDLTALTGANTASDDVLLITDVSASTSNKITLTELNRAIPKYAIEFTDNLFTLADNTTSSKKAQFQLSGISVSTTRTYTLPNSDSTLAHIGSDAQTFAGAVQFTDSLFTLADNSTPSKKAQFELSSLTSATTRTYTLPDVSATLAHLGSASQTFTGTVSFTNGIAASSGGTGIQTYTVGDILYASGTTALSKLADVATGNALISGGVGVAPSYGKIGLTTHVSGTLPIANGGTNATTSNNALANLTSYTTTATAAGTTTLTNTSTYYQFFTGTSTQTVKLPVTSTLSTGWSFHICNNSTGNLSVQASDNSAVITILSGTTAHITCISTAVTTNAAWESGLTDFSTTTGTGDNVLATSPTIVTPTITTSATVPLVLGGTGTGSTLTLQSTSGVGATDSIVMKVGNNGATTALSVNTAGVVTKTNAYNTATQTATNTATLSAAQITGPFLLGTPTATASYTLPLASAVDTALGSPPNETGWEFVVFTTAAFAITLLTNTGWTLVGSMATGATANSFARFRARKTGTGAYSLYRIS